MTPHLHVMVKCKKCGRYLKSLRMDSVDGPSYDNHGYRDDGTLRFTSPIPENGELIFTCKTCGPRPASAEALRERLASGRGFFHA